MKPSEVLAQATEMLEKNWADGTLQDGFGNVCAMGAISMAKMDFAEYPMDADHAANYREEFRALRKAMSRAPRTKAWEKVRDKWDSTRKAYDGRRTQLMMDQVTQDALVSLNDDDRAGQAEVVRVFKAATCIAKQKETRNAKS